MSYHLTTINRLNKLLRAAATHHALGNGKLESNSGFVAESLQNLTLNRFSEYRLHPARKKSFEKRDGHEEN
jgi:hypothetical protein